VQLGATVYSDFSLVVESNALFLERLALMTELFVVLDVSELELLGLLSAEKRGFGRNDSHS